MISVNRVIITLCLMGGCIGGVPITDVVSDVQRAIELRVTHPVTGVPNAKVTVLVTASPRLQREIEEANEAIVALPELGNWIGRTVVPIELQFSNGLSKRVQVVANTVARIPAVVAQVSIPRQTVIQLSQVTLNEVLLSSHRLEVLTRLEEVVGQESVTLIGEKMTITGAMVRGVHLVRVGDSVTVAYRKGAITLRVKGVALESGRKGERVRVRLSTNRMMEGVVIDEQSILVQAHT